MEVKNGLPKVDVISFISGGLSGIVQTGLGHPFDTLKTLIQSKRKVGASFFYSPKEWYRGAMYPLITAVTTNSIIFGCHSNISWYLRENVLKKEEDKYNIVTFCSGGLTGLVTSGFIIPFENWKIQQQTKVDKTLWKNDGIWKRAYRGSGITAVRESVAMSIYFSTYELMREQGYSAFMGGMGAGITNWLISYPIDTIKSRIQSYRYNTVEEAVKAGNLWRGLPTVLLRAGIVNGGIFYTYDMIRNNIRCSQEA